MRTTLGADFTAIRLDGCKTSSQAGCVQWQVNNTYVHSSHVLQ